MNKIINGNVTIGIEKEKNVNRRKSEKIEEEMFQKLARNTVDQNGHKQKGHKQKEEDKTIVASTKQRLT